MSRLSKMVLYMSVLLKLLHQHMALVLVLRVLLELHGLLGSVQLRRHQLLLDLCELQLAHIVQPRDAQALRAELPCLCFAIMLIRGEQRLELLVDLVSLVLKLALLVFDPLHAHAPALVVLLLRREFGAWALR